MNVAAVFTRAGAYLAELPPDMRELAGGVVTKARAAAEAHPGWALLALPAGLCEAYEVPDAQTEAVLAGAVLLYAAADVIDDAQDGDLAIGAWGDPPWHRGVNVGNALVFAALAAFLDAAPPGAEAEMARAVSLAGLRMTAGQHLDFALGPGGGAVSEFDYLACIEGKSGGSLGLFCRAAGLAAGRPEGVLTALEELGRCVGSALQIRSDVSELWSGEPSRDLANGRRTLPLLCALALADESGREELQALAADPAGKPELISRLDGLGAGPYCDLRLQTYLGRAHEALEHIGISAEGRTHLGFLLEGLSRLARRTAL